MRESGGLGGGGRGFGGFVGWRVRKGGAGGVCGGEGAGVAAVDPLPWFDSG